MVGSGGAIKNRPRLSPRAVRVGLAKLLPSAQPNQQELSDYGCTESVDEQHFTQVYSRRSLVTQRSELNRSHQVAVLAAGIRLVRTDVRIRQGEHVPVTRTIDRTEDDLLVLVGNEGVE